MAIEDTVSTRGDGLNFTALKRYGSLLGRGVLVTLATGGWIVFWAIVARMHVISGDPGSAAVVGAVFMLPAVIGYGLYMRHVLPDGLIRRG